MRLISFILFFLSLKLNAFDLSHLTREERNKLFNGEFVLKTQEVKDAPWPRLTILRIIDATPLEFGAFFANFQAQVNYVPDLKQSDEIKGENPLDVVVDYKMNLPWPISDAVYQHGHRLAWQEEQNFLKVEWYLVKSTVADHVEGFAEFYPYNSKTLWHYQTLVRPKSAIAGLLVKTMQKDTMNSLSATVEAFNKASKELRQASIEIWKQRFKRSTK